MSIIQEALKKAQKTTSGSRFTAAAKVPVEIEEKEAIVKVVKEELRATSKKNSVKSVLYGLAFLMVLSVIAVGYFSSISSKASSGDKIMVKAEAEKSPKTALSEDKASIFDTNTMFNLTQKAPTPPAPAQPITVKVIQDEDLSLSGIMHLEDGPRAIINNTTVAEGDRIEGALVVSIADNQVILTRKNMDIVLHLKKS